MGKKNKQQKQKAGPGGGGDDGQNQQQKSKGNAQQSGGKGQGQQEKQAPGKGQQNPQQNVQKQQQQLQKSQQDVGQGQPRKPQQGAWGDMQSGAQGQQQQKPQQVTWGATQEVPRGQQQQKPQQGAWGATQSGAQAQQQIPQQGAWGGMQSGVQGQQHQKAQQGGAQDKQQQQQKPQKGAWGSTQGGGQEQQRKPQQGAWGGQQLQQPQQGGAQSQQQKPPQGAWEDTQSGVQGQQQQKTQQGVWRGSRNGAQGQQQQQPQQGGRAAQGQQQKSQQGTWAGPQSGSQAQRQQRADNTRSLQQQNMQKMSISSDDKILLPNKPVSCNGIARGTIGQPGIVEVNYLKLDLEKMPNEAYHYDVTITPDRPKKFLRPVFEQCRLEMFPNVICAFDGMKNCYTLQRLESPIDRKLEVPDSSNRMKEFTVKIKETESCVVDLSSLRTYQNERVSDKPMRALQVLEVFLASNNHERGIRVGRSFFRRPDDSADLGDGYEAWTGLYQAAILGEQPLLNVDISHKSFPRESTLIEYLKKQKINLDADMKTKDEKVYERVCAFLKGLNIIYTPPTSFGAIPKQYKVLDIGEPAIQKKFKNEDGKELTVLEYYKSKGYHIKYPCLNCLVVGSSERQISLPMELCSIPKGQALNRKDGRIQVTKMIRYAATPTNERKEKIMDLLRFFNHNVNPIICQFGIRIGSNFIQVPMRLLPAPSMEYLQGQTVTTFKGAWRMDGKKFLTCSKPSNADGHKWAIIYDDNCKGGDFDHHVLEVFKTNVIQKSKSLNMNLQANAEIKSFTNKNLAVKLRELAQLKFDLVFVVINDRGTAYSKVKQIAELEVGILTQCIKDRTVLRSEEDITVLGNILLKVNGKLNGTNHKIAQDEHSEKLNNVMYLGADVTHPPPGQKYVPSVVGVAASHDPYGACYNCQYRLQPPGVEIIEDMESIVCKHLETYRKYQNKYPSLIIYYRDGVSDGQFPKVEHEEILAIKSACEKLGCESKLTCIIVVKRHHTRFFPLTQPKHKKDCNNVQAGTVVDQHITHPNEKQFFMVSHQSIQGTARPTRYNVIYDESEFDINLLQQLTYNLCHLFPRCNRTVSYPAPAYLAHLVAYRGRVYLEGTSRKFNDLKREYEKRQIKADFMIRNPMYFI